MFIESAPGGGIYKHQCTTQNRGEKERRHDRETESRKREKEETEPLSHLKLKDLGYEKDFFLIM